MYEGGSRLTRDFHSVFFNWLQTRSKMSKLLEWDKDRHIGDRTSKMPRNMKHIRQFNDKL
jgi:hypothetical protein